MLNCTLDYALYILSVDAQWNIAARKFPSAMAFFNNPVTKWRRTPLHRGAYLHH